jgi:hypothetical protein
MSSVSPPPPSPSALTLRLLRWIQHRWQWPWYPSPPSLPPSVHLTLSGTHCAGTAAGHKYGVAKEANLIAVRVLNNIGTGSTSGIIDGINWFPLLPLSPSLPHLSLSLSPPSTG